jgi:hypothetical protein
MTDDPTPDHEPGHGPDGRDLDDPLTADHILSHPPAHRSPVNGRNAATPRRPGWSAHFRLWRGANGRTYATAQKGAAVAFSRRGGMG